MKKLLLLVTLVVMPLSISTAQGLYGDGDDYEYGCGYECEDDYRLIADIRSPDPIEEPKDYSEDIRNLLAYTGEAPQEDSIVQLPFESDYPFYGDSLAGEVVATDDGTTEGIIEAGAQDYLTVKERCKVCDDGTAYLESYTTREPASEPSCDMVDEDNNCVESSAGDDSGGGSI